MSPVFEHGSLRLYLLKLLDEQPRHGYDLMQQLENRFQGLYSPSAGTIYPRLARLHAEGLVEPVAGPGGRKTYQLTDAGRAELAARRDELADLEASVVGSARSLAREIRADVRASVADLRGELKNAVREVRREERRTRGQVSALQAELEWFSRELTARLGNVPSGQAETVRRVLESAVDEVVRAVNG